MKQLYKDLRSTTLVALIAFSVCWACNIWVFPGDRHHIDPDNWLKQQLHMTREQVSQLEPVEVQFAQRRTELHAKIKVASQELAKVLIEEKHYSSRVQAASEKVDDLQADLKDTTLKHFYEMQPAMTQEQVQRMNELVVHALSQHE